MPVLAQLLDRRVLGEPYLCLIPRYFLIPLRKHRALSAQGRADPSLEKLLLPPCRALRCYPTGVTVLRFAVLQLGWYLLLNYIVSLCTL